MNITRNVINDLLPAYLAGEASDDTRALLEEYLRANPDYAAEVKIILERSNTMLNVASASQISPDREKAALERVRTELQKRSYMLALAIAFTLVPFSFTFEDSHMHWAMLGSNPMMVGLFWFLAAIWWVSYFVTRLRLRQSGV